MLRTIIRTIMGVVMVLALVMLVAGCATKPKSEPGYAGLITEDILMGMNEGNYARFSEHFDETMKNAIPEASFQQLAAGIKAVTVDYVPASKEFGEVITSGIYTDVFYEAKFTG